jgi:hypothetical protein
MKVEAKLELEEEIKEETYEHGSLWLWPGMGVVYMLIQREGQWTTVAVPGGSSYAGTRASAKGAVHKLVKLPVGAKLVVEVVE